MLTKIKGIIVKIALTITGIFAAVFYVLFQQKKDEKLCQNIEELKKQNEELKEEQAQEQHVNQVIQEAQQAVIQEQKENEELTETALGGNNLSSFHAAIDLLRN